MRRTINLIFLFGLSLLATDLIGQVTIGSGITPNQGTLLDLKEFENEESKQGGKTANRGMMLPRVNLSFQDRLQPMYSYTDESSTPSTDDLISHAGLTVFNMNRCVPFSSGVYVWDGEKWTGISSGESLSPPSLMIGVDTLHIPSGMDARPSEGKDLTFTWEGTSPTFTAPIPVVAGNISGGLSFTSPRGWTPASGSWTSSPATLSVWADDIASTIVATNPWTTRLSKIIINIPENECGDAFAKELYLNQTNYVIIAGSIDNPIKQIMLRDVNLNKIKILSNVPWQVTAVAEGGAEIGDILESYTTDVMDNITNDGTTGDDSDFTYKSTNTFAGKRYSSGSLTFKDPSGRAKDYLISIVKQCQGTPNMDGVYQAASDSETSNGNAAWSGKVVRHPAKAGVYAEFYSADFGSAGRWMITNLAAEAYDGIEHSSLNKRKLTKAANTNKEYNKAYWAYPSTSDLMNDEEYRKNPFLGYLYTWDAATAGKGSIPSKNGTENGVDYINTKTEGGNTLKAFDGEYNIDKYGEANSGWIGDQKEAGMKEWDGTGTRANDTQARRQGICPKGWHLPSDYEWTELEREIIRNTTKYADVQSNIDAGNSTELDKVVQATVEIGKNGEKDIDNWRGTSHGQAVRDACEPNFTGTSNSPKNNGFAILLPGYGDAGKAGDYGVSGIYWTSSIAHGQAAYGRIISSSRNDIYRYRPYRYYQFPVRCKKD